MTAKMFPHLKLLCSLFMGPTLGFDTKQRNRFFNIKFCVFYNKSKVVTILFTVKYEKITLFDEFLVLSGTIISRLFACSNEGGKGCMFLSYLYANTQSIQAPGSTIKHFWFATNGNLTFFLFFLFYWQPILLAWTNTLTYYAIRILWIRNVL